MKIRGMPLPDRPSPACFPSDRPSAPCPAPHKSLWPCCNIPGPSAQQYEDQGDAALYAGEYDRAISLYYQARTIYSELELYQRVSDVQAKIDRVQQGMAQADKANAYAFMKGFHPVCPPGYRHPGHPPKQAVFPDCLPPVWKQTGRKAEGGTESGTGRHCGDPQPGYHAQGEYPQQPQEAD